MFAFDIRIIHNTFRTVTFDTMLIKYVYGPLHNARYAIVTYRIEVKDCALVSGSYFRCCSYSRTVEEIAGKIVNFILILYS